MKLVVTGAGGFLGWHVRVLAKALGWPDPVLLGRADLADPRRIATAITGTDRLLHLAGVSRGAPEEIISGNVEPATVLASALRSCQRPPGTVVFANSVQAGNGSPYGDSKAAAAAALAAAGAEFVDVLLPNLYGEHGRPFHNSVVSTFCHTLAAGGRPEVRDDHPMELVHVGDAAARLIDAPACGCWDATMPALRIGVRELASRLGAVAATYRTGGVPPLPGRHDVRLFNTYRSHCFPEHYPLALVRRADSRGELVEVVRAHGGPGQTFFSTSRPGATRGEHFHMAKVERFAVVSGTAEIRLRRVGYPRVTRFTVNGGDPVVIDIPTMWTHHVANTGPEQLLTVFWSNQIFDSARPDTYPDPVMGTGQHQPP